MEESAERVSGQAVAQAVRRVCDALEAEHEYILNLDQQMGDGDLGITVSKIAAADRAFAAQNSIEDIGKFLAALGMESNKAAPSTMGTLLATALLRAGKEVRGASELNPDQLCAMLRAAEQGMQERGKAQLGDKTVMDALHPAVETFTAEVRNGKCLAEAGRGMVSAAEAGRDRVTPLQSKVGRASWVGERTIGLVDPGCAALVIILRAILGE